MKIEWITKEEVEEYFNAEADFILDIWPYKEIKIRRYHIKNYEAADLIDLIERSSKLDYTVYVDEEDPRYNYIEVWKVADRIAGSKN